MKWTAITRDELGMDIYCDDKLVTGFSYECNLGDIADGVERLLKFLNIEIEFGEKMNNIDFPHFVFRNELTNEKWIIPILSYLGDSTPLAFGDPRLDDLIEQACIECDKRNLELDYGVHDYETSGEYELIGFTSYAIDNDKYSELIEIWKSILIQLGFEVGEKRLVKENQT